MNLGKAAVISVAAVFLAALWSDFAEAGPGHRNGQRHHMPDHHGARLAVFAAPLLFVPRYVYPAPVYYTPPPPPVYIEQPQTPQYQPESQAYWYYCPASRAYYPHVANCPGGWQKVPPAPPPG